jgi:hypothetical protein
MSIDIFRGKANRSMSCTVGNSKVACKETNQTIHVYIFVNSIPALLPIACVGLLLYNQPNMYARTLKTHEITFYETHQHY